MGPIQLIRPGQDQWLPQLNALINRVNERFSAAFDRGYLSL